MRRINIDVDTVEDGVQCVNRVTEKGWGYYSIILVSWLSSSMPNLADMSSKCDLHMPNKDGFETCKELRQWENDNHYSNMPIIALSANVLGDVYSKCVEAQFNSYVTKPVDFKELSTVLTKFVDPDDPSKPHEFMKLR